MVVDASRFTVVRLQSQSMYSLIFSFLFLKNRLAIRKRAESRRMNLHFFASATVPLHEHELILFFLAHFNQRHQIVLLARCIYVYVRIFIEK